MTIDRRTFMKTGASLVVGAAAGGALDAGAASSYDPAAKFELKVSEIPYRRNALGRELKARVYQPAGAGPFPVVLDLHGGAWIRKDRLAEEPMNRAIAASGVLVVAIDLTLSGEAPYPANVLDASYGVRWLKSTAAQWNGDASTLGLYGSSSGGHVAQLIAMRPRDARYNAVPLPAAPGLDSSAAYVATRSPISDTYARWQQAEKLKRENLITASKTYFRPWESIHESNPQEILDRREQVVLPPMLIMVGELDDNILPSVQEKFAKTYRAAGGDCRVELFPQSEHEWVAHPGPQTTRAQEMVKAFIARNLKAAARAA